MTTIELNKTATPPEAKPPKQSRKVGGFRLSLGRQTGVVVALVLVCIYFAVSQSIFFTWGNICNIVSSNSIILVLALGATFVIISGGIDLSTASAAGACGMALGIALRDGAPFVVALVVPLVAGLLLGLVNGVLISWVKMSFLVVTLGAMSIYSSIALVSNKGTTISVFAKHGFHPLYTFVNGRVGNIPYIMIFDLVLALIAAGVLRYTAYGRALFAVGSNVEAARINGVNVSGVILSTYVLAGLSAGVGSLVQVGRLTGAAPQVDSTQLMTVIAAVLIGGTAFSGGEGSILGTVVGVLFLGVITNGLTLSQVSAFWQGCVTGGILLLAVAVTTARDRGWIKQMLQPMIKSRSVTPAPGISSMSG
jgi:ribose transport system permease protein